MFLIIKDNNKYIKQSLGTYYKYKGITIYKDIDYCISLDDGYSFYDGSKTIKVTINKYIVNVEDNYESIELYFYDNDKGINDYSIYENMNFILSSSCESRITNLDKYVNDDLKLSDGMIYTNSDLLLVNSKKYKGEYLKEGDFVEFLGFNFYYYDNFLYINNFNVDNKLNRYDIKPSIIHKNKTVPILNNYYENPKVGLNLDKLEVFNAPKKSNNRKVILQIGPTITMSLAMIMMAAINVYNTYLNNGNSLNIASILIMPITMLISGILWPVIASTSENRGFKKDYKIEKNEYLEYLKNYDQDLSKNISLYIKEESRNVFNTKDIENNKLFYINKNSKEFLNVTLGFQTIKKSINYKLTKDNEINEYINRIKYRVENIENCPLYLNIKSNKVITIVSYINRSKYLLKRYLLELIYKYNYDDLYIAIYSKDKSIYKNIFNIPHILYSNKRLTLVNEKQLQEINNYKLDKPLVLLLNDYTDFHFTNNNIHVIYFSNSPNMILKNSDCIVEYRNNTGVLNGKCCIPFNYYEEDIDFNKYFNYISVFSQNNINNDVITFKNINGNINIVNNYLMNNKGLIADFATINNEVLSFDLHESKDGPHGLIGGSTGSGKSELIVSLLLSLAIRYSPEYLNIILIDYKGGSIKESLSYNSISIPHIIAAINNLESDTFERLIVAISRECKRRQELFKVLSNKSSTSISNLDDYLEVNKDYDLEKIAHLLIVVDEFAELKKESPLIIKELISFSRIGRSLGIHLILATQRPSGVIDDEIWSNSHFKIALKVHSERDSEDIIKSKEAAYLTSPGEFYLKEDDNIIKAKAIYSKKDINNNDQFEVELLNNLLEPIKKKKYKKANPFFESSYYTSKIIEACNILSISNKKIDYLKPTQLHRNELKNKYINNNQIIIGEIDDYLNARKGILEYKINENLLIYSSRNNEINNYINILKENERQTIVISNTKYESNYISDSILYEDDEDIKYLFNKLINDKNTDTTIIIEDLNTLLSYDEEYLNIIYQLLRRSNVSNYSFIIITKQSNINFKLLNSIKNKVAINIYDNQDLINIFSSKGNYKGNSFYFDDGVKTFIETKIENVFNEQQVLNNYVDKLPEQVKYEYTRDSLLIGYDLLTRKQIRINDNDSLLICSYDIDLINKYKYIFISNPNATSSVYNNDLLKNNYHSIIWLGEGLYSQRLFYVDKEVTIGLYDAYYYSMNKGRIIRPVNYE